MKTKCIKMKVSWINMLMIIGTVAFAFTLASCDDDDPEKENVPELITRATLTFTPTSGGTTVTVSATDPDGKGVNDLAVDGPINLAAATTYVLTIELVNELADPGEVEFDITKEVEEEGDEHLFFFGWTGDVFADPTGNGNIDNRTDEVNYEDEDENGLPLGLTTSWTTTTISSGTFRVVLKHQPDLKTTTSDFNTGETDADITFTINVN